MVSLQVKPEGLRKPVILLYLVETMHTVICQFYVPYSTVWPAKRSCSRSDQTQEEIINLFLNLIFFVCVVSKKMKMWLSHIYKYLLVTAFFLFFMNELSDKIMFTCNKFTKD